MGERLRGLQRGLQTWWAALAAMLLLASVAIALSSLSFALRASQDQLHDLQLEAVCRARASTTLEVEISKRDDALADLQESLGRLLDASIRRDQPGVTAAGAQFAVVTDRIHAATEAISVARDERVASVDACSRG